MSTCRRYVTSVRGFLFAAAHARNTSAAFSRARSARFGPPIPASPLRIAARLTLASSAAAARLIGFPSDTRCRRPRPPQPSLPRTLRALCGSDSAAGRSPARTGDPRAGAGSAPSRGPGSSPGLDADGSGVRRARAASWGTASFAPALAASERSGRRARRPRRHQTSPLPPAHASGTGASANAFEIAPRSPGRTPHGASRAMRVFPWTPSRPAARLWFQPSCSRAHRSPRCRARPSWTR